MNLIVETDLGRDPDDLFTLLYLVAAGVDIRCITISPGDWDQVAIASFLREELELHYTSIGVGKLRDGKKTSSGGVHYKLLKHYGYPLSATPDGFGSDLIERVMESWPGSELFAIGPLTSVGEYLQRDPSRGFARSTMQGGFVSYDLHQVPVERLEKFEGLTTCPTFNMNGDIKGVERLLASPTPRSFVGKNVCHTIVYNREVYKRFIDRKSYPNRAMELFAEAMGMYLEDHDEKKFHDPTAAVCHLHPEIGTWYEGGQLYRAKGGWGTMPGGEDRMLIDIDRPKLWDYLWKGV